MHFIWAYEIYTYFIPWCLLLVDHFVSWNVSHPVTSFCIYSIMIVQHKCWPIIASVISNIVWRRYMWYHFTTYFWSFCGITIFSLYVTSSIVFWSPQKEPFWYVAHLSFSVKKGYYRWYWYISLNDRVNVPSRIYLMSYSSDIVFVVCVDSCVVSWFPLLGNRDSLSATIFFLTGIY